jgi:hypothetical protein
MFLWASSTLEIKLDSVISSVGKMPLGARTLPLGIFLVKNMKDLRQLNLGLYSAGFELSKALIT